MAYNYKLSWAYRVIPLKKKCSGWREWHIMHLCLKVLGHNAHFSFFKLSFMSLYSPLLISTTPIKCKRTRDLWLISRNRRGWSLQTGNSLLKYTANDKLWVPIRVQRMRVTAANGLKQKQWSHFRCEEKENRRRVHSWWGLQTVWWDTTLAITVSTKTGIHYNLPQH